ncbi:MAG: CRISPR-associated CARF protein Csa3, partial [Thermoproteota archaeon]
MRSSSLKSPKIFIFNLGFDATHIIARLTSQGVSDGDKVLIVLPSQSKSERVDVALSSVDLFLRQMESRGVRVELKKIVVNELSLKDTLTTIYHTLSSEEGQIFVELSGGLRILVLATYLAASLKSAYDKLCNIKIVTRLESTGAEVEVPPIFLPAKLDLDLLGLLNENQLRISQLSKMLSKEKSSISRKIRKYEQMRIVQRNKNFWTLTDAGRILYEV